MLFRCAMWNGTAIAGWLLLAPLSRPKFPPRALWFIALWVIPSMMFHVLVHVGDADQTLSTIPAFCLLGGTVLVSFYKTNRDAGVMGVAFAIAVNLALFVAPFPLRPDPTFYKPAVDALWQTSYQAHADVARQSETVLTALAVRNPETMVIWNRSPVTWRTLSYYFPDTTFCVLLDDTRTGNHPHAALWRGLDLRERFFGEPASIPLGDAQELIWVLGVTSSVRAAAAGVLIPRAEGVYASKAVPIELPGYRLVP
jgi:hypothetical protein